VEQHDLERRPDATVLRPPAAAIRHHLHPAAVGAPAGGEGGRRWGQGGRRRVVVAVGEAHAGEGILDWVGRRGGRAGGGSGPGAAWWWWWC
jgi:hypothetical protein